MINEELLKMAGEEGFIAAVITPEEIPVNGKFRRFCEENLCGKYNANYSCPPACGTVEELHTKLLAEEKILVVETIYEIESYEDQKAINHSKVTHNQAVLRLFDRLRDAGYAGFCSGYNGCPLCSPCKQEVGEPCAYPERRISCMSAYCIDVAELASRCGLEFAWTPGLLYLFGMIALHEKGGEGSDNVESENFT